VTAPGTAVGIAEPVARRGGGAAFEHVVHVEVEEMMGRSSSVETWRAWCRSTTGGAVRCCDRRRLSLFVQGRDSRRVGRRPSASCADVDGAVFAFVRGHGVGCPRHPPPPHPLSFGGIWWSTKCSKKTWKTAPRPTTVRTFRSTKPGWWSLFGPQNAGGAHFPVHTPLVDGLLAPVVTRVDTTPTRPLRPGGQALPDVGAPIAAAVQTQTRSTTWVPAASRPSPPARPRVGHRVVVWVGYDRRILIYTAPRAGGSLPPVY
jgi:hypothetical protein